MDWLVFVVFLATCFTAASTGAMFSPGAWYRALDKPSWTPPDWMFPVVWTILYIAIAVAAARIAVLPDSALAVAFWALQIALNTLWSPVFFGLHRLRASMVVMAGLWLAVLGTLVTFWMLDTVAGLLILPYLVWVSVAGALNASVLQRNPQEAARPAE